MVGCFCRRRLSGAHNRDRTGDLVLTKDVLYQLSYVGRVSNLAACRHLAERARRQTGLLPLENQKSQSRVKLCNLNDHGTVFVPAKSVGKLTAALRVSKKFVRRSNGAPDRLMGRRNRRAFSRRGRCCRTGGRPGGTGLARFHGFDPSRRVRVARFQFQHLPIVLQRLVVFA